MQTQAPSIGPMLRRSLFSHPLVAVIAGAYCTTHFLIALLFSRFLKQLWIMPAFGARPQFDNDTELNFYGDSMWPAIVDICLPFGIFYRMHAVASLLEVYIMS